MVDPIASLKRAAEHLDDAPFGFDWSIELTKYGAIIRASTTVIPYYSIDKKSEPVAASGTLAWDALIVTKTDPLSTVINTVAECLLIRKKELSRG